MATDSKPLDTNRLSICLDNPSHGRQSYVPGDVLEGEIVLHNPYHAAGLEASITFSGVSKVRFKEKGRLFSPVQTHEDEFVSSAHTHLSLRKRPGAVFGSFRIPIPCYTSRIPTKLIEDESFAKFPGYSLPPSFGEQGQTYGSEDSERSIDGLPGRVVYSLVATLQKPFFTHSYLGPTLCQMRLPLSSLCTPEDQGPASRTISFHHHNIDPRHLYGAPIDDPKGDGAGMAAKDNDDHAHIHCLKSMSPSIHVQTLTSTTLTAGQPLCIFLSFDHNIEDFVTGKLPPLVLRTFNVEITSETRARVPSALRREPQARWAERCASCSLDVEPIPLSQRFCNLTEGRGYEWDITSLAPRFKTVTVHTPTFKTSNIALSYTLHVRCELGLGDEKIEFDARRPLIVWPRYRRELAPWANNQMGPLHIEGHQVNEGDVPPPYSEHQGASRSIAKPGDPVQLPNYQTVLDEKR
ncbi:MAG: hypothetical protein LQ346_008289 [Caloplaca aetnensis]|nr:MAG: hypothetical protein LQ346_008289 [Caloplaca aetnensis]